ncbi:hypothetical protein DH2020_024938 [Rehmannia glutinosa]|uniref:Homeobox domain-containing protein n=1 Tax=Rehmannia glutinosa TaxID=99300 RepID=A0ABR0W167_REHGL
MRGVERRTENVKTDEDPSGWRPYYTFLDTLREKYLKNEAVKVADGKEGTSVRRRGRPRKNQNLQGKRLFDDQSSSEEEDSISGSDQDAGAKENQEEDEPLIHSIRASSKLRSLRVSKDKMDRTKTVDSGRATDELATPKTSDDSVTTSWLGVSCHVLDLIAAVKGLHELSPQQLSKLIRDSGNNIVRHIAEDGSHIQILLDDVKVSEQLIDLVFYLLVLLGAYRQVDIFMDAAFSAVCIDVKFLQTKLSVEQAEPSTSIPPTAEETLNHLCQQCDSSLQFLQSLCQQKLFRERIVKNKELCGNGGVLVLVQAVLNLKISPLYSTSSYMASVARLKSKALSILLYLCEAECVSYLDEVASNPGSQNLAKSTALQVLELLKNMFGIDSKQSASSEITYPKGQLELNAMRLADVFSDDSNFRSFIMINFTEVLAAIFLLPHGEFLSGWCSSDLPVCEDDATLEYVSFTAPGWFELLYHGTQNTGVRSSPLQREVALDHGNNDSNMEEGTPNNVIFREAGQLDVSRNGNDQCIDGERKSRMMEQDKSYGPPINLKEIERDARAVETSGSDSSPTRGKNTNEQMDVDRIKGSGFEETLEDERVDAIHSDEKQQRKRKRTIMNDKQIALIESALVDEPDMHRNSTSLRSWAEKLSLHVSINVIYWLNNRKARLARAAKDVRVSYEGDNHDRQGGSVRSDSPLSPMDDARVPSAARGSARNEVTDVVLTANVNEDSGTSLAAPRDIVKPSLYFEPGQYVMLVGEKAEMVGKGKVFQVRGKWCGRNLEQSGVCVVDILELSIDRFAKLPHPMEVTGNSFDQAEKRLGLVRVVWDLNKLFLLPPR